MNFQIQTTLIMASEIFVFIQRGTQIVIEDAEEIVIDQYETTQVQVSDAADQASQIILGILDPYTLSKFSDRDLLKFYLTVANIINTLYLHIFTETNQNPGK